MFFKKKEMSRINQYEILGPIQEIVEQLHTQQKTLANAAKNKKPHTIEASKYRLITLIVKNIA